MDPSTGSTLSLLRVNLVFADSGGGCSLQDLRKAQCNSGLLVPFLFGISKMFLGGDAKQGKTGSSTCWS